MENAEKQSEEIKKITSNLCNATSARGESLLQFPSWLFEYDEVVLKKNSIFFSFISQNSPVCYKGAPILQPL